MALKGYGSPAGLTITPSRWSVCSGASLEHSLHLVSYSTHDSCCPNRHGHIRFSVRSTQCQFSNPKFHALRASQRLSRWVPSLGIGDVMNMTLPSRLFKYDNNVEYSGMHRSYPSSAHLSFSPVQCPKCTGRFGSEKDMVEHYFAQRHLRELFIGSTNLGGSLFDIQQCITGVQDVWGATVAHLAGR